MTTNADFPEGAALVVGGSGGTGQVICQTLAQSGSDIALTYNTNEARAGEVVSAVEALGRKARAFQMSIGDVSTVDAAIAGAVDAFPRIHTVVVAAGSDIAQDFISEITQAQWAQVIDADLNGFFNIVKATLPHLREKGGGSYVHVSSAGLLRWPERDVLSVAPKAAIDSLITGIAKEEGKFGIRANSVLLGVVEAGIFLRLWSEGVFDEKWKQAVLEGLAIKRFGQPEEIANAVTFLASNRASYITGQMLNVSGGYGI